MAENDEKNEDLGRLDELFAELEGIADAELMRKMGRIPEIEPAADFREAIWAKIDRVKEKEAFFEGLFPRMPWPAWTAASLILAIAWGAGIKGGASLYNKDEHRLQNPTEQGLSEFGSSYSPNSIEGWVIKSTFSAPEE